MTAEEKLTMAVTPQVLEDYHNTKVAPFLNPAIQYFGKSDVYSTSERWIGQWIDKRPLYQNVKSGVTNTTENKWKTIVNLGTDYTIVRAEIWFNETDDSFAQMPYGILEVSGTTARGPRFLLNYDGNNDLSKNGCLSLNGGKYTEKSYYCIYQYIKTTDSPISVPLGDPNEYTTDERWVGMWMGQPLYQKTVNCGALPNNTRKEVSHGISNISNILFIIGYWNYQNSTFGIMPWTSNSSLNEGIQLQASKSKILIDTKIDYSDATSYVTLRYTKTS